MSLGELDSFPRFRLGFFPTPVIELKRLSARLGGPRLFMKRDDETGLALGGNKTRKLEFFIGEAINEGCDTLMTGGAAQSNHCRQTAAAAAAAGLHCHLVLGGTGAETDGNVLLNRLLGAHMHWTGDERKGESLSRIKGELEAQGHRPYVIPYGGSNALGALGFVVAMDELIDQLRRHDQHVDVIVIPCSSGGTQAGLVVGSRLLDMSTPVIGIQIDKEETLTRSYTGFLTDLANTAAGMLGVCEHFSPQDFDVRGQFTGGGYGVVGDLEREAIELLARHEGILLDPVYTGRAMGALITLIGDNAFAASDRVLFWHTGGAPALFHHVEDLMRGQ